MIPSNEICDAETNADDMSISSYVENSENSADDGEIKEEIDPWATMVDVGNGWALSKKKMKPRKKPLKNFSDFQKIEFADVYLNKIRLIEAL